MPLARMDAPKRLVSLPRPAFVAPRAFSVRLEAPLRLPTPAYPERTLGVVPLGNPGHNHSASLESMIGYVETPFVEEARLPVASLAGGRLEFGPFYSFSQTENVLFGLQGSGSLPAWSVSMQNHPGAHVPLADESYGLSLSIRLKREAEPGPRIHVLRCLAWVLRSHGCRSN